MPPALCVCADQVFNEYAKGDGAIGDELHSKYLLEFAEWKNMLRDLKIIGEDITPREVAMTFVWARLRVCDVRSLESQVRMTQLHFTDFLEAIVRLSTLKRLPTDEQIYEQGYSDAGEYCLKLNDAEPAAYAEFMKGATREWDSPLPQPIFRLVDHMCCVMVMAFEELVSTQKKKSGGKGK